MTTSIKSQFKAWCPPVVLKAAKQLIGSKTITFQGPFSSWDNATANSVGYDADGIIQTVRTALLKVKTGAAVYERDSVLFDRIELPHPLLAGLLRAACGDQNSLKVLDFGGSLGSTYFQCRKYLAPVRDLKWAIVEQDKFVDAGNVDFATDELQFFKSFSEAAAVIQPNVVLFSGSLQYVKEPYTFLEHAIQSSARYIFIERTPFSMLNKDIISVQKVPKSIYDASYPCWIFGEQNMRRMLERQFQLVSEHPALDADDRLDQIAFSFKGMTWERK